MQLNSISGFFVVQARSNEANLSKVNIVTWVLPGTVLDQILWGPKRPQKCLCAMKLGLFCMYTDSLDVVCST